MLKLLLKGSKGFPAEWRKDLYTVFGRRLLTGVLCWPNKFSLPTIPRAMRKKYATGRPDQKDLNENLAATQGLAHMIVECNHLFEVREPVVEMMQKLQGWMQYPQPTLCVYLPSVLPHVFIHPIDPS